MAGIDPAITNVREMRVTYLLPNPQSMSMPAAAEGQHCKGLVARHHPGEPRSIDLSRALAVIFPRINADADSSRPAGQGGWRRQQLVQVRWVKRQPPRRRCRRAHPGRLAPIPVSADSRTGIDHGYARSACQEARRG